MATDEQLRETLILAFEHLRAQQNAIYSLLAEIGALRDSLCEIGPKYKGILDRHRAKHIQESSAHAQEDLSKLDSIIQRLKDGYIS
jgi:hypothetical protein